MVKKVILMAYLCLYSIAANCSGWDSFGDHSQLKGYFVVDVGEVSEVPAPANTTWNDPLYKMNDRCFTFFGYQGYWGYGTKAGLLVVNDSKLVKLALVETSISSVKVELKNITLYKCP